MLIVPPIKCNVKCLTDFASSNGEDVQGIEKKWIASDRAAFPDMRFTAVDSIAESNKITSTFVVEGTHKQEFRGIPATHKKFETVGITVFHFDGSITEVQRLNFVNISKLVSYQVPISIFASSHYSLKAD